MNMGWTAQQLADYTRRRLKDEAPARKKLVQADDDRNGYNKSVVTAFFREYKIDPPLYEMRVCMERRWRFDIAWTSPVMLAIEVQGGIFVDGAHVRGAAMLREYEKLNHATSIGWRILFVTPDQLMTAQTAELVRRCLSL